MIADQLLGIPFVPVFLDPTAKGKAILKGVNYASGGAGILDFTGYTFVSLDYRKQSMNEYVSIVIMILCVAGEPDSDVGADQHVPKQQ